MLSTLPAPTQQIVESIETLPLLNGSDPRILATYQWAVVHSPSLQQLIQQLITADPKARYRLVPGVDPSYGKIEIIPTKEGYEIDIQVPIIPWVLCWDALEPWIASSLFLACQIAKSGLAMETRNSHHLKFYKETMKSAFDFQAKVRKELVLADPIRLKNLPDGFRIYAAGFPVRHDSTGYPLIRMLPYDKRRYRFMESKTTEGLKVFLKKLNSE